MPADVLLDGEAATVAAGRGLAHALLGTADERVVIHLRGDLGAGKTTFARGVMLGLGYAGRVPSPTYTLVEPYELDRCHVYHVDLYRLADAAEVDDLALADLGGDRVILLIEWPERGAGRIERADLEIRLAIANGGRTLAYAAGTAAGRRLLARMSR
jgi:tRNA threonylcarbamoyladenosine biosynthesis protein TsaE